MLNNTSSNDIELRKLSPAAVFGLTQILECGEAWKQLMGTIPLECKDGNPPKYTAEHIKLIESTGAIQKRPCSEIFLDEWGTSGRQRPHLSNLLHYLVKADLHRGAEYVAVKLLKVDPPKRPMIEIPDYTRLPVVVPMPGLNAQTTFNREENTKPIDYSKNHPKVSNTQSEKCRIGSNIQELPYTTLVTGTHNFNEECCIGGGAWGTVYLGDIPPFGCVAVKKLHSSDVPDPVAQFRSEIETLSQLSHENLLPLFGFSVDGPSLCLIYQFMENGALQDRLSSQDSSKFLSCKTRLDIALGAASGLCHLHNALDRPIVHRDVKTANILLDSNLTPKLGDFGLVRYGSNGSKSYVTTTIFGTSAYMAPEAFRGDVSIKMDVFSFGVVLLELLTGLPPFDEDREGWDIVSHVLELDDIITIVDNKGGKWNENIVNNLYCLIKDCLHSEKKKRPNMNIVLERLKELKI